MTQVGQGQDNSRLATITIDNIDKTGPDVQLSASNITTDSITLNVIASDDISGLPDTPIYRYYQGDNFIKESQESSYVYKNLSQNTDYTLRVDVTDRAGNTTSESIGAKTLGGKPEIQIAELDSKTTDSLTFKAMATHAAGSTLKYELYVDNEIKDTLENQEQNTEVSLTASSLAMYQDYNCYIAVTDTFENTENSENIPAKTKCSGRTKQCTEGYSSSYYTCSAGCSGHVSYSHYHCSSCGKLLSAGASCTGYTCGKSYGSWATGTRSQMTNCPGCGQKKKLYQFTSSCGARS